ncbi:uncharacterized protein LTR77_010075 [Saxophila tyrrhenica]|uniref:Heterokaryon incompatibility domain-containing protein n=1 Tax=Saxophila tyrrhenica TaxID=1690608 RepID=A0AAV9NWX1_9PEZI|nr:hypothetical protein LTR77_010075 [Saxophila tyrrhenica]
MEAVAVQDLPHNPYPYEELQGPSHFRLFNLLSEDDPEAAVRGEILQVSPSDGVQYEALSYYWGTRSSIEPTVSIAGLSIPITDNLYAALLRLRRTHALGRCNLYKSGGSARASAASPSDAADLSKSLSGPRLAWRVGGRDTGWPSLPPGDWLRLFGFYNARLQTRQPGSPKDLWRSTWTEYLDEQRLDSIHKTQYKDLLAVTHLLERAWFGRAWVIQEFAVNDIVRFTCGEVDIPHNELRRGFYAFTRTPLHHQVVQKPSDVHNFRHLETLVAATDVDDERPKELQLLKYLIASREFGAQDPRDKVFALAGMALDGTRTPFEPNYDSDHGVELLYHRVAVHYIAAGSLTEVLMEAGSNYSTDVEERNRFDTRMPSWVPDWRQYVSPRRMLNNSVARELPPSFELSEDGMVLKVRCYVLDTIQVAVSSRAFRDGYDLVYTESSNMLGAEDGTVAAKVPQFLSDLRRTFCNRLQAYVSARYRDGSNYCNGQSAAEALRRTLYCNGSGPFTVAGHVTNEARTQYDDSVAHWLEHGGLIPYNSSVAPSMPPFRRDFLMTERGYIGWGPMDVRKDDLVVVVHGMPSPSILRRVNDERFCLLGDSYVHGFMDGEVVGNGSFEASDISLV